MLIRDVYAEQGSIYFSLTRFVRSTESKAAVLGCSLRSERCSLFVAQEVGFSCIRQSYNIYHLSS